VTFFHMSNFWIPMASVRAAIFNIIPLLSFSNLPPLPLYYSMLHLLWTMHASLAILCAYWWNWEYSHSRQGQHVTCHNKATATYGAFSLFVAEVNNQFLLYNLFLWNIVSDLVCWAFRVCIFIYATDHEIKRRLTCIAEVYVTFILIPRACE
jgi:hypothetical protein